MHPLEVSSNKVSFLGLAQAQYHVACYYEHGRGVSKDQNLALKYLKAASVQGHTLALVASKQLINKLAQDPDFLGNETESK